MGISVRVVEYTGQFVSEPVADGVNAVCQAASSEPAEYPLLAGVDEYDDTTFNARQAVALTAELTRLAAKHPRLGDTIAALIALAELLPPAPRRPHHRRLVFNGD